MQVSAGIVRARWLPTEAGIRGRGDGNVGAAVQWTCAGLPWEECSTFPRLQSHAAFETWAGLGLTRLRLAPPQGRMRRHETSCPQPIEDERIPSA